MAFSLLRGLGPGCFRLAGKWCLFPSMKCPTPTHSQLPEASPHPSQSHPHHVCRHTRFLRMPDMPLVLHLTPDPWDASRFTSDTPFLLSLNSSACFPLTVRVKATRRYWRSFGKRKWVLDVAYSWSQKSFQLRHARVTFTHHLICAFALPVMLLRASSPPLWNLGQESGLPQSHKPQHKLCSASEKIMATPVSSSAQTLTASLWEKVFSKLDETLQSSLCQTRTNKRDILEAVQRIAEDKRDASIQKRWKFKSPNGEIIILRDVLEKITKWIIRFKGNLSISWIFEVSRSRLPWSVNHIHSRLLEPDFGPLASRLDLSLQSGPTWEESCTADQDPEHRKYSIMLKALWPTL